MSFRNPQYQGLDNQQLSRINSLCDQFEEMLQDHQSPAIGDFLQRVSDDHRAALVSELLSIEIEFRSTTDPDPDQDEYEKRYPEYHEQVATVFRDFNAVKVRPSPREPQKIPNRLGDFLIHREVGRGGMGIVYEAQQESLDRRVALKVLSQNAFADGQQRERFDREAHAAGSLHHSNIVPVFGVGNVDGFDYLVMQLIDGMSLETLISKLVEVKNSARSGNSKTIAISTVVQTHQQDIQSKVTADEVPSKAVAFWNASTVDDCPTADSNTETRSGGSPLTIPVNLALAKSLSNTEHWRTIADLIRQAADALHYSHGQGVLHRDIKPGNLLLDTNGRMWITDFGLAKAEGSQDLTQTGTLLGTVRYMPPEAFEGQTDHTADVYALGLSLYELAALRPAFEADDNKQVIRTVMHTAPPALKNIAAEIPRDLQTIIHKAIEREPRDRYATAADFAEDLRRFCHDEPILARRVSVVEQVARWARQHKLVAALASTLAVVLLSAVTILSIYTNRVTGLNSELNENAALLTEAKNSADTRSNENAALARKAQSAVVGMKIASAYGHVNDGKISRALIAMQSAWESDTFESRGDRAHQMRIGALLDHYPELEGLVMSTEQKSRPQYQPWNDLLMVSVNGVAEFWKPSNCELIQSVEHESKGEAEMCSAGKLLITRHDNECCVWNIHAGNVIHTLKHKAKVLRARFSPDASTIVTACADGTIRFWDAADGRQSETNINHDKTSDALLNFVDNDRIIGSSGEDQVRMWSTRTGEAITPSLTHRPSYPFPPSFTIADERIATIDGKKWFLWDLNDGAPLANFETSRPIESVHFCEHGGDVLVNAASTSSTWHYDFDKGMDADPIVKTLTNPRQSNRVAISPGGDLAAARSTGGTAFVWNLRTHEIIAQLENVRWLEFVDYRRLMVTGSNTTRVFSLRHRHKPKFAELVEENISDGLRWNSGDDWTISGLPGEATFRFANGKGQLIDGNGTQLREFKLNSAPAAKFSARFGTDRTCLCTVNHDLYSIWDAATGKQIGHSLQVPDKMAMHTSADGIYVTLLFESEHVAIWNMELGRFLVDGRPTEASSAGTLDSKTVLGLLSGISSFVIAPNGEYVVISRHGSDAYHIVDVETLTERFQINAHRGVPATIQFTADSSRFITANSDTTVRVWDAKSGTQIGPHLPHPTFARAATISDDGSYAATRDSNGEIRTWDVRSGEQLGLPFDGSEFDYTLLSFSEDLNRLVATPVQGSVLQHRLPRLAMDRASSRHLVELVTNLRDFGSGRSETLTGELMQNREQYMDTWRRWRQGLDSSQDDLEAIPTDDILTRLAKEIDKHASYGNWTCDGETLMSDETRFTEMGLPVAPTGSYQISMDFTRRTGNDHIGIQLPFSDGRAVFVVDSAPPNGRVSLEGIDGRVRHESGQDLGALAPIGQQRSLKVNVLQRGAYVDITAKLDGTEIYNWSGRSRRLIIASRYDTPHHRRPALQTHKSRFGIRNVRVTEVP